MKFKLDENLDAETGRLLERAGHDVSTVPQQQLEGTNDANLLRVCTQEGRCLVTLDREFANPLVYPPQSHAGVILLRLSSRPSRAELRRLCETLIRALETDSPLMQDRDSLVHQLWIVQQDRVREYSDHR